MPLSREEALSATQRTILACVAALDAPLPRSTLAKLLAGSQSARTAALHDHPFYGRLAEQSRKAILYDVDILLQQRFLALDGFDRVVAVEAA